MKRFIVKAIPLIVTYFVACDTTRRCGCSRNEVCVTIMNAADQRIETVRLSIQRVNQDSGDSIETDGETCLSFDSPGENSFMVMAILSDGEIISSTEVYSEGGYKFIATVTKDTIKIAHNNAY